MKKILLILTVFFIINFSTNAFTRKEYIQENLSRLGVNQDIIDETIMQDMVIGTNNYFEENDDVLELQLKMAENLLKRDERNFIAADFIITNFQIRNKKEYKKYLELFEKYNPYKPVTLLNWDSYYTNIENKKEAEKYLNKIKSEYGNDTFILKIAELNRAVINKAPEEKITVLRAEVIELAKSEKAKRKYGITDEEVDSLRLANTFVQIVKLMQKKEYQKTMELYLNQLGKVKMSKNSVKYNSSIASIVLFFLSTANNEIQDEKKAKEYFDKIAQTDLYKRVYEIFEEKNRN
jgi:hypothetical protein cdivTM_04880